ncbi:hypothetical protein HanHA89_Chr10g0392321 [Helianthus annuus]|nr:hypothetical protein HanHA89_Chr10g0392321 [Helianthus annuus]
MVHCLNDHGRLMVDENLQMWYIEVSHTFSSAMYLTGQTGQSHSKRIYKE